MSVAFVLGNGKSRMGLDLDKMRSIGPVVGCNAIYRDWMPDVLVAVDPKMVAEVTDAFPEASRDGKTRFLLTERASVPDGQRTLRLDGKSISVDLGMNCGPTAGWIVPLLYPKTTTVYLVGMDQGSQDNRTNNVYAGSHNYAPKDASQSMTSHWARHWRRTFEHWRRVRWAWRRPWLEAELPQEWHGVGNVGACEGTPW